MADKKDLDDFWDIDSLIPEKKGENSMSRRKVSFDTSVADVEDNSSQKRADAVYSGSSFTRFVPPHTAEEFRNLPKPQVEYKLAHSLVHEVKIYETDSKYNFYDRFFDDAVKLRDKTGEESPLVPFFSYTPQYSQMNRAQLAYYLWWRENVRKGIYLTADYSYVLLYLYEIINLSEISDKVETLDMMCNIWLHYGEEHPFVSKYLGEWVCDFCLINRLPVPAEKLKPLYPMIMKNCLIKEFYVVGGGGAGNVCADTLIEIASAYDYRKSRYATADKLPILRKHLVGALDHVLSDDGASNPLLDGMRNNIADNTAVRTSYSGALCTGRIRRKIEIRYYSFSRSYELRYLISDIMKYSENRLRKIWGIKSRLNIYALPTSIKNRIDEYFDSLMPTFKAEQISRERDKERMAEYEKLYDIPRTPLSPENAAKIEENSWETTKILIETFDEDDPENVSNETNISVAETEEESKASSEITQPEQAPDLITVLGDRAEFLIAVLSEDMIAQRECASKLSMPSEAIVDEINEIAADMLGDILIEDDGDGFKVIEDYRGTVEAMLEK